MAKCETCGNPLPVQNGRGRPRKYHDDCKPKRNARRDAEQPAGLTVLRSASSPVAAGTAPILGFPPRPADEPVEGLYGVTLAELQGVARHRTTQGVAALHLARLIDAGQYNAQGAATLVKAHREALDIALQGTAPEADVIDVIFSESG